MTPNPPFGYPPEKEITPHVLDVLMRLGVVKSTQVEVFDDSDGFLRRYAPGTRVMVTLRNGETLWCRSRR